ncbi:mucin-2-like isoform X2 [Macrobrachium nipponense]
MKRTTVCIFIVLLLQIISGSAQTDTTTTTPATSDTSTNLNLTTDASTAPETLSSTSIPTNSTAETQTNESATLTTGNTTEAQTVATTSILTDSTTGSHTNVTASIPTDSTTVVHTSTPALTTGSNPGAGTNVTTSTPADSTTGVQTTATTTLTSGSTPGAQTNVTNFPTDSTTGAQETSTPTLTTGNTAEGQTTAATTAPTNNTSGGQTTAATTAPTSNTSGGQTTVATTATTSNTSGGQTTVATTATTSNASGGQTTAETTAPTSNTSGGQTTAETTAPTSNASGGQTTAETTAPTRNTSGGQTTAETTAPTSNTNGGQTTAETTAPTSNTSGGQTTAETTAPTSNTNGGQTTAETTAPTSNASGGQTTVATTAPTSNTSGGQTTAETTAPTSNTNGGQTTAATTAPTSNTSGGQTTAATTAPTSNTSRSQTTVATTAPTSNASGGQTTAETTAPTSNTSGGQTTAETTAPTSNTNGGQTTAATTAPTSNTSRSQTTVATTAPTSNASGGQTVTTATVPPNSTTTATPSSPTESTNGTQTVTTTTTTTTSTTTTTTVLPDIGVKPQTTTQTVSPTDGTTETQKIAPTAVSTSTAAKGCQNNWISYNHGESIYKEDCHSYTCLNGVWTLGKGSDPYCCNFWNVFGWNLYYFSRDYINWNRFRWWYTHSEWYSEYYYRSYDITYNGPLNTSIYNSKCQRFACVGRDTINITAEVQEDCCEYKNVWYHHGQPIYKDDCVGYVCLNGKWLETSYRDPKCCRNPDTNTGFQEFFNDVYDYYDSFQNYFKSWYKLNETRPLPDCRQVTCASRDNWVLTGVVIPDCRLPQGCDFNGTRYTHMARLPGCFQVFCVRGVWIQRGHVDSKCGYCTAQGDPHLRTFDGMYYDYQGTCEYSIAQEGKTTKPQYAVISQFRPCWSVACVGPSTFKDNPGTIITMGTYGRDPPDLYKILVNGVLYEIPDEIPRFVREGTKEHPVLAWRYGYWCIRLIGSSQISMERCGWSVSVWALPEFQRKLYGLCGYFDGNVNNDFMRRDGTTSALQYYPRGVDFPDSWETSCATGGLYGAPSGKTLRRMKRSEPVNCTLEREVEDRLRSQCNQIVEGSGGLPAEMITPLIDNCVFDVCSIYQNTSGNASAIEEWLGEVRKSAADISDVQNKTTDADVPPEILFQDPFVNVTVTTVVTEATKPGSSGPLPDKDNYGKREKLILRLVAKVNIGSRCWTSGSQDR